MHILYYWHGVIVNEDIFAKYYKTLEKILSGQYKSADLDLKKLPGFKIYTIRINRRDRLVFTTRKHQGKSYLELIDVITNHEYEKSSCFQPAVLRRLLERNEEETLAAITEHSFVAVEELLDITTGPTDQGVRLVPLEYYNGLHIELDEIQNNAKNVKLPALISGAPGSGKSCVALAVLAQAVRLGVTLDKTICYVTESTFLQERMQTMWSEHPLAQNLPLNRVQFMSFEQVMRAQCEHLAGLESVGEPFFAAWFKNYQKKNQKVIVLKQPVALIYQELCILSALATEEYLQLGKRQSLVADESSRRWLMTMKSHYQEFLQLNKKVDFHLFTYPSPVSKYGLIVVDEGQDYTALQLEQLAQLSGFQILICQDTLQSVYEVKAHSIRFEQKLFTQNIKLSRTELQGTYRCPLKVVDVANRWLELKYLLLGGTSDKYEAGVIKPHQDAVQGTVRWYAEQPTAEDLALLKSYAQTTRFAVVTTADRITEAQQLFGTPLVFTAAQIKGLDYETVLLYQLLNTPALIEANKRLQKKFPQGINFFNTSHHRAKFSSEEEHLLTAFNQVFTATTRMTQQLLVWQKITHDIGILANSWQKTFISEQDNSLLLVDDVATDWQLEAERQQWMGNDDIAEAIIREKIKSTEPHQTSKIVVEKKAKQQENSANTGLISEKKLRACLRDTEALSYLFTINAGSCILIQVFQHPKLEKILLSGLTHTYLKIRFVEELLKTKLNAKPLLTELIKLKGFATFMRKNSDLWVLVPLQFLGQEFLNQNGEKTTFFKEMVNSSLGCEFLSICLKSSGILVDNIKYENLIACSLNEYPIFVSLIINQQSPQNLLQELIHKFPTHFKKMQANDLTNIYPESFSKMAHTSLLYWLASCGKNTLSILLTSLPHLVLSQYAFDYFVCFFYEYKERRSVFYHLFVEEQDAFNENIWNDYGFNKLLNIPENELFALLRRKNNWSDQYSFDYTHLYQLARTSSGCGFLLYLIKLKPQLLTSLKQEDLLQVQFFNSYQDSVCSALVRSAPGRQILNTLMQLNPLLFQGITLNWLRQGLADEENATNLFHLSKDNQGVGFLFNLMQMNPELQGIEYVYLGCPYSNRHEGYVNASAFYNLSKSNNGHKILELLLHKEQFLAKIGMGMLTLNTYSGDKCLYHSLHLLVQYHSFMGLDNPIWIQLMDRRADLKSEIMGQYLLDYYGPIKNCFLFCAMIETAIGKKCLYDYWQEGNHFKEFLTAYEDKLSYGKIKSYTEERMKVPAKIIFDFILSRKPSTLKSYSLKKLIKLIGFSKNPFMYYLTHPDFFLTQFKMVLQQYPQAAQSIIVDDLLEKNNMILSQILHIKEGISLLYEIVSKNPSLLSCLKQIPDNSALWLLFKNPDGDKIMGLYNDLLIRKKAIIKEAFFSQETHDSQVIKELDPFYPYDDSAEIPWRPNSK